MTEGEQNRLIVENAAICAKVCSDYRGMGVDFEDLLAEAQIALVEAARAFNPSLSSFSAFASLCINRQLINLVNREDKHRTRTSVACDDADGFGVLQTGEANSPAILWEWDAWSDDGNARAICEWFTTIAIMPGDVLFAHDTIRDRQDRFASANIGLKPLEKRLIAAYFNGESFVDIARLNRMTYRGVLRRIEGSLRMMRDAIAGQDRAHRNTKRRGPVVAQTPKPRARVAA